MQAGVYKREGSQFLYLRYTNERGRTVRKSSGTSVWAEAKKALKKALTEVEHAKTFGGSITYRQAVVDYLKSVSNPGTLAIWKSIARRWDPIVGGMHLREIGPEQVQQFIQDRRKERVKDSTTRLGAAFLSALCTFHGIKTRDNPLYREQSQRVLKKSPKLTRFVSREEEALLIEHCQQPLHADMIRFAIETGLRKREQTNLLLDQIDLVGREILLRDRTTKDKEGRIVPLSSVALEIVERYLDPREEYLFRREGGQKIAYVETWWLGVRERARLPKVRWHDLRHTFATRWLRDGGEVTALSRILGHSDLETTMRYVHVVTETLHYQMRRVEQVRAADEAQPQTQSVKHGEAAHAKNLDFADA